MPVLKNFLGLFQYTDPEKELQYRQSQELSHKIFTLFWCATVCLLNVILVFQHWNLEAIPYSIFTAPASIIVIVLVLNLGIPWCRPYMVHILAIATLAYAAWSAWVTMLFLDQWLHHLQHNEMAVVWNKLMKHPKSLGLLDDHLTFFIGHYVMTDHLNNICCAACILVVAGLNWCTTLVVPLLVCVYFGLVRILQGEVFETWFVIKNSLFMLMFIFINFGVAFFRRQHFDTQYHFETRLAAQLDASTKADSLLNHGLKNTMADAAGNLDIFLSQFERNKKQVNVGLLKMSREGLQRGMLSCRNREIYINLCAGAWQPDLAPVSLPAFAEALLQGRPVASDIVNVTVRMDQTLCWLVFDNAITNALRHGDPTNPDVRFTITCPASPSNGSKRNLSFRVSNRASPRPLRLNQVAMIRAPENQGQSFSLSEDLLMEHIRLGAAAQGMTYSFGREGDLVVFRANLEVELAPQEQVMIPQPPLSPPLPSGLTYLFIDDSDSQRRLVDHGIRTRAAPRDVLLFGKNIAEVEQFLAVAVDQGRQAAMSDNPHGLVAILDQNIDVEGEEFKGTAFVTELLGRGFPGLLCIRSANNTESDATLYLQSGAHCVLGKELRMSEMIHRIAAAYHELSQTSSPLAPRTVSGSKGSINTGTGSDARSAARAFSDILTESEPSDNFPAPTGMAAMDVISHSSGFGTHEEASSSNRIPTYLKFPAASSFPNFPAASSYTKIQGPSSCSNFPAASSYSKVPAPSSHDRPPPSWPSPIRPRYAGVFALPELHLPHAASRDSVDAPNLF